MSTFPGFCIFVRGQAADVSSYEFVIDRAESKGYLGALRSGNGEVMLFTTRSSAESHINWMSERPLLVRVHMKQIYDEANR